jgi:hypothetical protein
VSAGTPGTYAPLAAPTRVVDTRETTGRQLGVMTLRLPDSVPADATAVLLNVTVTGGTGNGHVVVYPAGSPNPGTSNVNFVAGETQANLVMTRLGANRQVAVEVVGNPAYLVIDLVGSYTATSAPSGALHRLKALVGLGAPLTGIVATTPSRALDTRTSGGAVTGARTLKLPASVPADAKAVLLNVTATGARSAGHVTAYAAGTSAPGTSNVNVTVGRTQANLVLVRIGADRSVVLNAHGGPMQLIADLVGYQLGDTPALPPTRLLDSRIGQGTAAGRKTGPVTLRLPDSVPADAKAVVLNLTVDGGRGAGHVTAYAAGTAKPDSSNVNYRALQTQANLVVTRIGPNRSVVLDVHGAATHLIADLVGVYR